MISYKQSKRILKNSKIKISDEFIKSINSVNRVVIFIIYGFLINNN